MLSKNRVMKEVEINGGNNGANIVQPKMANTCKSDATAHTLS